MKKTYLSTLCLLLTSLIAGGVGAAPSAKDPISTSIINDANNPVPVDVLSFTPSPPIPFEFIGFTRQYCSTWGSRTVIAEDAERRLIEYLVNLPRLVFDREVSWQGNVYGDIYGPETRVAIGHSGNVTVYNECVDGGQSPSYDRSFLPQLTPGTNQYVIDRDVNDFACQSSEGGYPVYIRVAARVMEYKDRDVGEFYLVVEDETKGTVCFNLESVIPR
jgi:hypothetical protein